MQDSSLKKYQFGNPPAYPSSAQEKGQGGVPGRPVPSGSGSYSPGFSGSDGWGGGGNEEPAPAPQSPIDDLARIFNTAVVATKTQENRDFQSELYHLMESPA